MSGGYRGPVICRSPILTKSVITASPKPPTLLGILSAQSSWKVLPSHEIQDAVLISEKYAQFLFSLLYFIISFLVNLLLQKGCLLLILRIACFLINLDYVSSPTIRLQSQVYVGESCPLLGSNTSFSFLPSSS